jgi:hypothetical protein
MTLAEYVAHQKKLRASLASRAPTLLIPSTEEEALATTRRGGQRYVIANDVAIAIDEEP